MSDCKQVLWDVINWYVAARGTEHENRERKVLDLAIDAALVNSGIEDAPEIPMADQDELEDIARFEEDEARATAEDEAYRIDAKMCPICRLPKNNYCRDPFHATADAPPEPTEEMVKRAAESLAASANRLPTDWRRYKDTARWALRAALAVAHTKQEE